MCVAELSVLRQVCRISQTSSCSTRHPDCATRSRIRQQESHPHDTVSCLFTREGASWDFLQPRLYRTRCKGSDNLILLLRRIALCTRTPRCVITPPCQTRTESPTCGFRLGRDLVHLNAYGGFNLSTATLLVSNTTMCWHPLLAGLEGCSCLPNCRVDSPCEPQA